MCLSGRQGPSGAQLKVRFRAFWGKVSPWAWQEGHGLRGLHAMDRVQGFDVFTCL